MSKSLETLRNEIAQLESYRAGQEGPPVLLGHPGADAALKKGLLRGCLHEIHVTEKNVATGTGFAIGLMLRLAPKKQFLWIQSNMITAVCGQLYPHGLSDLGLNPYKLILVRSPNAEGALHASLDGLSCRALGAVMIELWGEAKTFDLVASRRLSLTAARSNVPLIMLRAAASVKPNTAETRWVIESRPSYSDDWGNPIMSASLVRNRHGKTGCFLMEWKRDECIFIEPPHPGSLVPETADRQASVQTEEGESNLRE